MEGGYQFVYDATQTLERVAPDVASRLPQGGKLHVALVMCSPYEDAASLSFGGAYDAQRGLVILSTDFTPFDLALHPDEEALNYVSNFLTHELTHVVQQTYSDPSPRDMDSHVRFLLSRLGPAGRRKLLQDIATEWQHLTQPDKAVR